MSLPATPGARIKMPPGELMPPGPLQVSAESRRVFSVLEGSARLELPPGPLLIDGPGLHEVAPDTPHRLLKEPDSKTTVLLVSDPGPTDDVANHFSCGNRALWCDLVGHLGIAQLHLDSQGHILDTAGPVKDYLGLSSTDLDGTLGSSLLPRDSEWLKDHLGCSGVGQPAQSVWANPKRDEQVLQVTFVPFTGDTQLASALVYLLPIPGIRDPGLEDLPHDESPALPSDFVSASPRMEKIRQEILHLADTDTWMVIWGEKGTGKSTVARLFHGTASGSARALRVLACRQAGYESLRHCLFREDEAHPLPGPWLAGLRAARPRRHAGV